MASQLRLTVWPGGEVPVPPTAVEPVALDGEWLVFDSAKYEYRPVPADLYLYEAQDVDLADASALVDFTANHGRMAAMWLDDLPPNSRRAIAIHAAEHRRSWAASEGPTRVHVDEIGWRIRVLRQLGRHAVAYARGDYEADVWPDMQQWYDTNRDMIRLTGGDPDEPDMRRRATEWHAWDNFTHLANAALRPFHVRVYVDSGNPDFNLGDAHPSLYSCAVLQVVNAVARQAEYRRCAACDRLFERQRGRSTHYSRSSGVIYCSASCANAQAQRAWRQRNRAKGSS